MYVPAPEITTHQVLQAFHRDVPFLFLGAAIVAVGVVAAAFSALRRRFDPVLIYFALFAILYGVRIWLRSTLMGLTIGNSSLYPRFVAAIDFIVPVPAFFFFKAAGLIRRQAKVAGYVLGIVLGSLALGTLVLGPETIFYQIANVLVIAAVIVVVVRSIRSRADNQDLVVIRRGGLIFVVFILWENTRSFLGLNFPNIEPIGFIAFLAALGYVAARQTLQRDQQLSQIQKELEVARRIQLSILPAEFPPSANFRVAARYVPMNSVAGDFYDFIVADDTQAGLLIADVSGHGVPAALIASMVKVAATSQRANAANPAGLLRDECRSLGNTRTSSSPPLRLDSAARPSNIQRPGIRPCFAAPREVMEVAENAGTRRLDFATYTNATCRLDPAIAFCFTPTALLKLLHAETSEALSALLRQTAGVPPAKLADQIISTVQGWSASRTTI